MNALNAKFVVVEGLEGAGKSTVIQALYAYLQAKGEQVLLTREPGGTPLAELIRNLLKTTDEPLESKTELLLLYAARLQHIKRVIEPALTAGKWVICDRYEQSSFAYQGGGRGLDMAEIRALSQWSLGDFKPGLSILMDVQPEIGMQRAAQRSTLDRIEAESLAFFERARAVYLDMARCDKNTKIVDANQNEATVVREAIIILAKYHEQHEG